VKRLWVKRSFMGETFMGETFMGETFMGETFMGETFMGETFVYGSVENSEVVYTVASSLNVTCRLRMIFLVLTSSIW